MTGFPVTVTEGQIVINDLLLMADHDDVKFYYADCKTKYGELLTTGSGGGELVAMFNAGPNTLRAADTKQFTEITFKVPLDEGWTIFAEISRYSIYITLVKMDALGNQIVWKREE